MVDIEVTAWIPVRRMLRLAPHYPNDFYDCLSEFQATFAIALGSLAPTIRQKNILIAPPASEEMNDCPLLKSKSPLLDLIDEIIKINLTVTIDEKEIEPSSPKIVVTNDLIAELAALEVAAVLEDILLLSQIAYPGRIRTETGICSAEHKRHRTIDAISSFTYDNLFPDDKSWPSLSTTSFDKVYTWEVTTSLFSNGVARNPLQRALAYFTHAATVSINRSEEVLFRTMQGLEAFYCRGTGNLTSQLSEKSRIFLNQPAASHRAISKLYALRSRFVHGDFNVQRWNFDLELEPEDFKQHDELSKATGLSIRMLIATLQKCAQENIIQAEFDYSLKIATS